VRKILVFQHVPFEPLGTLDRLFKMAGFRIRYINFDRRPEQTADLSRYHGLVVLGGPMAADQTDRYAHLAYERAAIGAAIDLGLPVLGICLGAQLIAAAIGGRTLRARAPEYGWVNVSPTTQGIADPLLGHLKQNEPIFQWHSDTFTLPPEAVHLAESESCRYQAFRYGDQVYGLQFHLEADRSLISRWLDAPRRPGEIEGGRARYSREQVITETDQNVDRATELGSAVFGAFIERFYGFRRRRSHGSR
jgi:GMP synthase (glutamine-hydrolysing)